MVKFFSSIIFLLSLNRKVYDFSPKNNMMNSDLSEKVDTISAASGTTFTTNTIRKTGKVVEIIVFGSNAGVTSGQVVIGTISEEYRPPEQEFCIGITGGFNLQVAQMAIDTNGALTVITDPRGGGWFGFRHTYIVA